jgi:hypothetical protein
MLSSEHISYIEIVEFAYFKRIGQEMSRFSVLACYYPFGALNKTPAAN